MYRNGECLRSWGLETEWFRISSPRTWICDQDGSCNLRCPWRCSSRRIRRIGSWRIYWSSDRRPSRGRGRWSSRHSSFLSVVLPSLLVSLLPTIPVLSAVLSYNDSVHVPAISDAVVPSARFRVLVDARPDLSVQSTDSTGPSCAESLAQRARSSNQ